MKEIVVHIKDGKIVNRTAAVKTLMELKDGKYLLTLKSIKKRSLSQNNYYWANVVPMVLQGLRDAGYDEVQTNDEAHEVLKHLFLKKEIVNKSTGELIATVAGSTTTLQTYEFNEYLEKIWRWAAEYLNVHIPAPNEPLAILYSGDQIEERDVTIVEPIYREYL